MTRITNLGRKRTYLEAGFGKFDADEPIQAEPITTTEAAPTGDDEQPSKKKPRKRRRKGKSDMKSDIGDQEGDGAQPQRTEKSVPKKAKRTGKQWREDKKAASAAVSERRRLKREAERHANTTCLACRKQGHAVKDCPEARAALHEDDAEAPGAPGKSTVGLCYRCGSQKHNLSRCKKPMNPANPLPFASCFVCSGEGHIASSCPKNRGKGIYPNGGSCKLCGQTSHLAKDCELRSQETTAKSAVLLGSTHNEGGADEDDFHVLKRRRDAVQIEEKILQKVADVPAALTPKPKPKVVVF